jgi:hypothetical protein
MNENHKLLIIDLAKSLTEAAYSRHLAEIRTINGQWAKWLNTHKHEFVATTFLDKGIVRRWGKVTSNAA